MKGIFLTIVLCLVYIALLTFTFEYFINRPSDTMLTLAGLGLFLAFTFLFIRILLRKFKNR
jgi:predicted neutral ceramidase superfamily lipid hydrolase